MRCWLVVAVGCFGCTASHAGGGGSCGPSVPCGANEICDLTNPGGAVCLSCDGDIDGDGIPNCQDFCEHQPGGRYDEDGDGLGDECDPCPIAPPPATPDPDGDAVDRPCDPDPSVPGDVIVAFSGFHELPAGWTPTTPSAWHIEDTDVAVGGGELVVAPPDPAVQQVLAVPLAQSSTDLALETRWRIDRLSPGAAYDLAIAAVDRRPAGAARIHCGTLRGAASDYLDLETDTSTATQVLSGLFEPATSYGVGAVISGATVGCALAASSAQGAVQTQLSADPMSEADLVVHGATVRFAYLLVVARVARAAP